jgi:hypothetical protein
MEFQAIKRIIDMGSTQKRITELRKAKQIINSLYNNSNLTLIIHYSCESLYEYNEGKTPRISSIAVKYFDNNQTKSFSIQTEAELKKVDFDALEERYEELEKKMLDNFFKFVNDHKSYNWVHWNMRNLNFGFEALENRYKILGGKISFSIPDNNKYDLSKILIERYGENYINHRRFYELYKLNNITDKHLLSGDKEAECYINKEYFKLHQSTLRKVDILDNILRKTFLDKLKTNSKLIDIYGISPSGIYEMMKENWIINLIATVILLLAGAALGGYFSN